MLSMFATTSKETDPAYGHSLAQQSQFLPPVSGGKWMALTYSLLAATPKIYCFLPGKGVDKATIEPKKSYTMVLLVYYANSLFFLV